VGIWAAIYASTFPSTSGAIVSTAGAALLAFTINNLRVAKIEWATGQTGHIFALKNICDYALGDFDIMVLPDGKAAVLSHCVDPFHAAVLLKPARGIRVWPDCFLQLIVGSGLRFVRIDQLRIRESLSNELNAFTPEQREDFDAFIAPCLLMESCKRSERE